MKCIECHQEAEYIYKGKSLCGKHYYHEFILQEKRHQEFEELMECLAGSWRNPWPDIKGKENK